MKQEKQVRIKRNFSESFKKSIVSHYESGRYTVLELEEEFGISNPLIYRWIRKYSRYYKQGSRVIVEMKSQDQTNSELRSKIKDLESTVGRKQMEIDYLEKLIEISEKAFKIQIKKKEDSSPLTGLKPTGINTAGQ